MTDVCLKTYLVSIKPKLKYNSAVIEMKWRPT